MDIRCGTCGEPWDQDELHYVDGSTYDEARASFARQGCVTFGSEHNADTIGSVAAQAADALMDMLGDDLDGVAAMLDDFAFLGMLDADSDL